jgi:hypothetical protein
MRCPVNHINELCISFMKDTLKDLFERCTDGIESPTVCSIMDTLRRQGLRNIDKYENIALLQKLEPIIRNAWANINPSLVREKLVKDNDTEVVCARARITGTTNSDLACVESRSALDQNTSWDYLRIPLV